VRGPVSEPLADKAQRDRRKVGRSTVAWADGYTNPTQTPQTRVCETRVCVCVCVWEEVRRVREGEGKDGAGGTSSVAASSTERSQSCLIFSSAITCNEPTQIRA
jgi:hypothetical protein